METALEAGEGERLELADHLQTDGTSKSQAERAKDLYRTSLRKVFGEHALIEAAMGNIELWEMYG